MNKTFVEKYVKIIVVFSVIAGATSGIFVSLIDAPPLAIGFWRLGMGLPFIGIPLFKKILQGGEAKREVLEGLGKKELLWSIASGVFLFFHFFTWFNGVKNTNIASAVVLASLHPLIILIITGLILRRHVSFRGVLGILVALLGGAMIAGLDYKQLAAGHVKGDILAFLAAMFMGIYFAIGAEVRKKVSSSAYVFIVFSVCFICFVAGIIATGTPILGYSTEAYLYIIGATLVCQIGAHAVFNLTLGYVDSLYVSAWGTSESAFAIVLGIIFLNQIPTAYQVIGAIISILGLLYYNYRTEIEAKEN